jgi:hypothetical protein
MYTQGGRDKAQVCLVCKGSRRGMVNGSGLRSTHQLVLWSISKGREDLGQGGGQALGCGSRRTYVATRLTRLVCVVGHDVPNLLCDPFFSVDRRSTADRAYSTLRRFSGLLFRICRSSSAQTFL